MPGFIGLPEIMLLALLALILFGPKRLPEMGRGLGKGMREFKDSIGGADGERGFDINKLAVPEDSTQTPVVAETVLVAADPGTASNEVQIVPVVPVDEAIPAAQHKAA